MSFYWSHRGWLINISVISSCINQKAASGLKLLFSWLGIPNSFSFFSKGLIYTFLVLIIFLFLFSCVYVSKVFSQDQTQYATGSSVLWEFRKSNCLIYDTASPKFSAVYSFFILFPKNNMFLTTVFFLAGFWTTWPICQ